MIEGAIFDLDGTLLDSMHIWNNMGENYLRSIGYEPRENLNETFLTMSLKEAAEYYISRYGVGLSVGEIMAGVNEMTSRYYRNEATAKPGVPELLERLKERGVKMCVATATDRPYVEAALDRCGLSGYFSGIFTCTEVGYGKNVPVIFRKALEFLGTEKEKTVIFEDALYAIKTAKRDGFKVAAIWDRHQKHPDVAAELADVSIKDFNLLEDFWKFAESL